MDNPYLKNKNKNKSSKSGFLNWWRAAPFQMARDGPGGCMTKTQTKNISDWNDGMKNGTSGGALVLFRHLHSQPANCAHLRVSR